MVMCRVCVVFSALLLLQWRPNVCGDVIQYSFNCQEPNSPDNPSVIACDGSPLRLACPPDQVVIATVCLGQSQEASACSSNNTDCLGEYDRVMANTNLIKELDSCLWKKDVCEISSEPGHMIDVTCSGQAAWGYDYVAAFSFVCLEVSHVFDICANKTSDHPDIGYVHNPGFPRLGEIPNDANSCMQEFIFDHPKQFNFIIQHTHLDAGQDYLQIDTLGRNGAILNTARWVDSSGDHRYHISQGYGFTVTLHCKNLGEFLMSYQVTNTTGYIPSSLPEVSTSESATFTSDNPPPRSRSHLENAGIALGVLYPLSVITIVVLLLLYVRKERILSDIKGQRSPLRPPGHTEGHVCGDKTQNNGGFGSDFAC